jgi:hypothetical protein
MGFEGEFASYEPLRRILDSEKIQALQNRMRVQKTSGFSKEIENTLVSKQDLPLSPIQPDLILAIDGSHLEGYPEKGFPGAEYGYVTIASVLIDLKLVRQLEKEDFINPKSFRETETVAPQDAVFPGHNITFDTEKNAKASLRRTIFEELKVTKPFSDGETLLDTYEHLLEIKLRNNPDARKPDSPIEGVNEDMTYDYGEYICPHSGEPLYSTDALRLHELMNPSGSNGELFGQIMLTLEKLWLVHILRAFERRGWLSTLRRVAFVMDGPLAIYSTSAWIVKAIEVELKRINDLQKKENGEDLLIIGIEKSGTFLNHFIDIDTSNEGSTNVFPIRSALLLTDEYIKNNIIFSESLKVYGEATYFGRKMFYKTASGQKLVPVVAWFNDYQKDIRTANPNQFARIGDVMNLLDQLVSSRYPNSISPLISAHAEAAIPLNLGKRIFEDIAREIKEKSEV